jgi:hypothetical protein
LLAGEPAEACNTQHTTVVCNATTAELICYTHDDGDRYNLQGYIHIGSCLTISHSASQSITLYTKNNLEVDLDYTDDEAYELLLKPEGGAGAGSPAVRHWVVTMEMRRMRAYTSAGPKKPGCWQVSNDGLEYDARDQAVIECWHKSRMSSRQAVRHATRLMMDVLASAESSTGASQPMKRLLTVLGHMPCAVSGYDLMDFRFLPFLTTAEALMAAPLPAHQLKQVAKILRRFDLQIPAVMAAAGPGEDVMDD